MSAMKQLIAAFEKRGAHTASELVVHDQEGVAADWPDDLRLFFDAVGGATLFSVIAIETQGSALTTKAHWDQLALKAEDDTGKFEHAHWRRDDWIPIADNRSHTQWAYAVNPCFGGEAGQVIGFDFKGGEGWDLYPTLNAWCRAWAHALKSSSQTEPEALAHEWAKAEGLVERVVMPRDIAARMSAERFEREPVAVRLHRQDAKLFVEDDVVVSSVELKLENVLGTIRAIDRALNTATVSLVQDGRVHMFSLNDIRLTTQGFQQGWRTSVWVFSLRELKGFCARRKEVVEQLSVRLLDVQCMVFVAPNEARYEYTAVELYRRILEREQSSPAEVEHVLGLLRELRDILRKDAQGLLGSNLPPGFVPHVQIAFHDSAERKHVLQVLRDLDAVVWTTEDVVAALTDESVGLV